VPHSKTLARFFVALVVVGADGWGGVFFAGEAGEFFLEIYSLEGGDDGVDVAFHDLGEIVLGQADAVVGHAVLGEIVGADAFAAGAGAYLASAVFGVFGVFFVFF